MDPGLVPGTGEKPLYQAGLHGPQVWFLGLERNRCIRLDYMDPRSGSWDWRETTVSGWTTWTPGLVPGTGEKPLYQAGLHGPQVWFLGLERNHCIRLDYMDPGLVPGTGEKPLYQAGLHGPRSGSWDYMDPGLVPGTTWTQVWFLGLERNHCIRLDYMDPRSGSWDWRETTVSGWTTWTPGLVPGTGEKPLYQAGLHGPRSGSWDWRETTVSGWTTWTPGLVPGTGEKPLYQAGLHGPQVWFLGLERNRCIRLDYMDPRSGSWDWRETTVSGWTTWTPGLVPGTGEKPLYQAGLHGPQVWFLGLERNHCIRLDYMFYCTVSRPFHHLKTIPS
ncbi:uncharacterized protein LOC127932048 isoform X22 [Oncorhynchus keta]|uniref:uncharacterized protein LOC127932048 isoform X22 n=2 Tax=Oncorhynchus keta TaxID=8018 RepID=UPI00227C07AB|nr:uncharacterized protein LOC127932048 isoform X22 [Oncorhynchus keta]